LNAITTEFIFLLYGSESVERDLVNGGGIKEAGLQVESESGWVLEAGCLLFLSASGRESRSILKGK
jgi:hypothetical protein